MGIALRKIRQAVIPDGPWQNGARAVYRILDTLRQITADSRVIGLRRRLKLHRDMGRAQQIREIRLPGYDYPIYYRSGTSDPNVILQIFARKEYECVAEEQSVECIVDCGANIGCTSFYLLHRYPKARVVVVEPDSDNMSLCKRNLAPYGQRVTYIQAGVWSHAASMVVERGAYRDGQPWAFQIREAGLNESPDFTAVTIRDLIKIVDREQVDLLKIDIEAAEREVFSDADWIGEIKTLVIELHDAECERIVEAACADHLQNSGMSGELTIYRSNRFARSVG